MDTAGKAAGRSLRGRQAVGTVVALLAALLVSAASFAAAAGAQPTAGAPQILDGPTPALTGATGLTSAVARDGGGALVYLKQVGGVPHVFASVLSAGAPQPPVQIDGGLSGPSSQPVAAAASGGTVLVGFINGGALYVAQLAPGQTSFGAPKLLVPAAANPALQMSNFGKGYLAYVAPDGAGSDVRVAYYYAGAWSVVASPLNVSPADDAGTGSGRPAVAAAGDGVGIVAWGEGGHIYTRRVWGTAPSVVDEQADGPFGGCSESSADEPAIGSGGDSSYAAVAFHEVLSCGGARQSRVLSDRLQGSQYDGVVAADGLTSAGSEGADDPQVVIGEYGRGWITSELTASQNVQAEGIGGNEWLASVTQVNSLSDASPPLPVPALAGYYSTLIAWQHDPGAAGVPEIRVRYADNGSTLENETVLSSPAQGAADAAAGLTAGGDVAGDALVAWVQSAPGGNEIVTDQLYQPPSAAHPIAPSGYVTTTDPTLTWTASSELWAARYTVTIDSTPVGQTAATTLTPPFQIGQGPHTWYVTVTNPAGVSSSTQSARFFVDTIAPQVTLQLLGKPYAGTSLKLHVIDTDAPPPLPAADSSGIALTAVSWGDGASERLVHWRYHVYKRPGRYRITVFAGDRAGNVGRATLVVVVHAKPKVKPKKKAKPKPGSGKRAPITSGGH